MAIFWSAILSYHTPFIDKFLYALVYNNIIEDSIVDNSYYEILKTIYFEDSESRWKTITYKNDE